MLREMTSRQWLEWREYRRLSPFLSDRFALWFARLYQVIWNVAYSLGGKANDKNLGWYLLQFGDDPKIDSWAAIPVKTQTIEERQEIEAKNAGFNLRMMAATWTKDKSQRLEIVKGKS